MDGRSAACWSNSRATRSLCSGEICRSRRWREALPLHLAVLAAKARRRWDEGQLIPFLAGRLSLLAEVPAILSHRRRLAALGPAMAPTAWGVEDRFWGLIARTAAPLTTYEE